MVLVNISAPQLSGTDIGHFVELFDKDGESMGEGVLTHLEHRRDVVKIRLFKVGNFTCWHLDKVTVNVYPGQEKS